MLDRPEPTRRPRVAFVVQRYGEEVNGGAEAHCRMVAERMTRHWDVEALTTCALDYVTWQDYYPPGTTTLNSVTVRRFPVPVPRDIERFNRLSEALVAKHSPSLEEQEEWMRAQGPWSPELVEYITARHDEYEVFVFFGYLYAQSYFGLPAAAGKVIFAPLAHDEWPIRLPMWDAIFAMPAAFMFNSVEERRFLSNRFPAAPLRGPIVGVAIERPARVDPRRFREAHGLEEDFILYVGRVDPSKGCAEMFEWFIDHARRTGERRTLVTMGRAVMEIPSHPQIRSLGFVCEETKWDALAACDLLLMPSHFESLSMVLLEAWSVGRPVLVNRRCEVLAGQVRRSHGGLAYESAEEFSACLLFLASSGATGVLGRQGYEFVRSRYSWKTIEAAYLEVVESFLAGRMHISGARTAEKVR